MEGKGRDGGEQPRFLFGLTPLGIGGIPTELIALPILMKIFSRPRPILMLFIIPNPHLPLLKSVRYSYNYIYILNNYM